MWDNTKGNKVRTLCFTELQVFSCSNIQKHHLQKNYSSQNMISRKNWSQLTLLPI